MKKFQEELIQEIKKKHGSISAWLKEFGVRSDVFYNWKKGQSTIQLATLEKWADSLNMRLSLRPRPKSDQRKR